MKGVTKFGEYRKMRFRVSIHTPSEGSDIVFLFLQTNAGKFQSTLPVKGVTQRSNPTPLWTTFQSTLPVKGVTVIDADDFDRSMFQSTLPVKGVTTFSR